MSDLVEIVSQSTARQRIIDEINSIDVSDFDASPWTDENIIRPLPGAQEAFLTTEAQICLYGGELSRHLSQ